MQAHQANKRSKQHRRRHRASSGGMMMSRQASAAVNNSVNINTSFGSQHQPPTSSFQLISPLSDLSNPSFSAFHKKHSTVPTTNNNKRTNNNNKNGKERRAIVLENLPPPDRISKNRTHVLPNNAAHDDKKRRSHYKKKRSNHNVQQGSSRQRQRQQQQARQQRQQAAHKLKNKVATYLTGGAHQVKVQTTRAVKQTSTVVKHGATAVAKRVVQHQQQQHRDYNKGGGGTGDHQLETTFESIIPQEPLETTMTTNRTNPNNNTSFTIRHGLLTHNTKDDSFFESLWRDTTAKKKTEQMMDNSLLRNTSIQSIGQQQQQRRQQQHTPTMALDKAFEDTLGVGVVAAATTANHGDVVVVDDDDYLDESVERNGGSPAIDQMESLASVDYNEDTTCLSYLISEPSQDASALGDDNDNNTTVIREPNDNDGTDGDVASRRVSTDDQQVESESRLDSKTESDEASRVSSEGGKPRTSHASTNLMIYSPETVEGQSLKSANDDSTKDNQEFPLEKVQTHPSVMSVESDALSPVDLMGELVSLGSSSSNDGGSKYSADQSESPHSTETSSSLSSNKSSVCREEQDGVSVVSSEQATKLVESRHVRKASYSSLPTRHDVSAIPFTEEGISAIVEQSILNLPGDIEHDESELVLNDAINGDVVTERETQQDESEVIVAISELPKTSDEENIRSSDESLQSLPDETDATLPNSRLNKGGTDSIDSESTLSHQDVTESVSYTSEMLGVRLSFPSEYVSPREQVEVSSQSPPKKPSSHEETSCTTEKQDQTNESAGKSSRETEPEGKVVKVKRAVATGRVFAPRSAEGLLRSIDMATVKSLNRAVGAEQAAHDETVQETGSALAEPQTLHLREKSPVNVTETAPVGLETIDGQDHVPMTAQCGAVLRNQNFAAIPRQSKILSKELRATPALDHHKAATMNEDRKGRQVSTPVTNRLASTSPYDSVISPEESPLPLVSDQALSNAAFLFSPSYAGGEARLLLRANPPREMHLSTFAISTAQSRSRLSTFSARSRPAFSIPISSAPVKMSSIRPSQSSYSLENFNSTQERNRIEHLGQHEESGKSTEGSEKHVHFSSANECIIIREANQSRVAMGTPITVVSPPPIDRKISDLTDATISLDVIDTSVSSPKRGVTVEENSQHQRIATILQQIEDEESTVEESVLSSNNEVAAETEVAIEENSQNQRNASLIRQIGDDERTVEESVLSSNTAEDAETEVAIEESSQNQIVSILQQIEDDESTVEESVIGSNTEAVAENAVPTTSSSQAVMRWSYREEDGVVDAVTPLRSNARPMQNAQLAQTNSPMLRFQEAKNKFAKPVAKVPTRISPSVKYIKTVDKGGTVHARATELNGRLRRNRQPIRKNPRRETGGENALAPRQATLEAPLFRNPVIMTYKDDSSVSSCDRKHGIESEDYSFVVGSSVVSGETRSDTGVSTVDSGDIKSNSGISTVVSADRKHSIESQDYSFVQGSSVVSGETKSDTGVSTVLSADIKSDNGISTVVSAEVKAITCANADASVDVKPDEDEDIFANMMSSPPSPTPEEREYPYENMTSDSEDDEDVFADVRRKSNLRPSSTSTSLESLLARDERRREAQKCPPPRLSRDPLGTSLRSLVSEDPSALTLDTQKENCVDLSVDPKYLSFTDKAIVNPHAQKHHAPPGATVCLSPTRRTPIQARKWRSLAAAAQEKNGTKKGSNSKKQLPVSRKGLLKERSSNSIYN